MIIADLHIHSRYSRATSRDCEPEMLDLWARRKGIGLLGTGDFTHPAWRETLRDRLQPAEDGLYVLREELRQQSPSAPDDQRPRFVVSGEISSIYKKNGRVRKVHNLILLPGLEEAEELSRKLEAIGNIHSDGRPILGLDSRDLLELTLETCPTAVFIPAHIWTPHFSLFGAFSGFDTIEECFEDLTPHIHALETGLSSDPPMNWRVSALDRYTMVSHSDAHSPSKLGREANLLDIDLSYAAMADALEGRSNGFAGTIEFFPEEGKYHFDGHRGCGLCLSPAEAAPYDGKCPVCGRKLTIGVQHRVEDLADRGEGFRPVHAHPFESLAPLPEVMAAATGTSATGTRVGAAYEAMLHALGTEFTILRETPLEDIGRIAGPLIQEGIRRLRAGQVERIPGYDGEYGKIQLLSPSEIQELSGQLSLFGAAVPLKKSAPKNLPAAAPKKREVVDNQPAPVSPSGDPLEELNTEQRAAVMTEDAAVAVVAGPGTGKTKTLVSRIAYLIKNRGIKPGTIAAVTFTNQAAAELRERLEGLLGKRTVRPMTIGTFHAIALQLLMRQADAAPLLIDEATAMELASETLRSIGLTLSPRQFLQEISRLKNGIPAETMDFPPEARESYDALLRQNGVMDFDDLILRALDMAETSNKHPIFSHLLIDEFQDINPIQYRLIQAWSKNGSLFVIGDSDQSIYGFRGADARCFERLFADSPSCSKIRLLQNYRTTPEILRCALASISHNPGGERQLQAWRPSGIPVNCIEAGSELAEAIFIAKEINRLVGGMDMMDAQISSGRISEEETVRGFSDIAVLYRTHRQAALLEKCLQKESIPYVVSGREDYLAEPAVRGILGFFRFWTQPEDTLSLQCCLREIFHCPPDLTLSLESAVHEQANEDTLSLLNRLCARFAEVPILTSFFLLSERLLPEIVRQKPVKLLTAFIKEAAVPESDALDKLERAAVFFTGMSAFLQQLTMGKESDLRRAVSGRAYISGAVSLMTLHGSKGLEFPVVFLSGVRKGALPLESERHPTDLEEERRLFFVGMTRAKDLLLLTSSPDPSPFLEEIPEKLLCRRRAPGRSFSSEGKQLSLFE